MTTKQATCTRKSLDLEMLENLNGVDLIIDSKERVEATLTKAISINDFHSSLNPSVRHTFYPEKSNTNSLSSLSFRASGIHSTEKVVEAISVALIDLNQDSYGKQGHDTYTCCNVKFDPAECSWKGSVDYQRHYIVKSRTGKEVESSFEGIVDIYVKCQCVKLESYDQNVGHYSIDLELIPAPTTKMLDDVYNTRRAMKDTMTNLGLDISKSLLQLNLPIFDEGCKGNTFRSIYQLNAKLKAGAFATVCLGTHRATGKRVAIKCVSRKNLPPTDDVAIFSEVDVLASLDHPYITKLVDFFIEKECYFIVMEYMEGGDLFDRIGKKTSYDESDARDLCRKMLEAIKHCHENGIAHCDLKPKNLLLQSMDDDSLVKLADFGFATRVHAPESLDKQCGTPYFVAPEILLRKPYDQKADMWSVGVIIYCLLSGRLPFIGKKHLDLFKSIISGVYTFDEEEWNDISNDAKDLIRKLLVTDPSKRLSASEALQSRWLFVNRRVLRRTSLINTSTRMRTFNARLAFKSAILVTQSVIKWRIITRNSLAEKKAREDQLNKIGSQFENTSESEQHEDNSES